MIDSVHEQARRHPDDMMMAFGTEDIESARKQKKLAALMGVEGGHAIENDIRVWRVSFPAWRTIHDSELVEHKRVADSSGDINDPNIEHHNGLTNGGKQIVLEMNRLGMMVDVSHLADKTFCDTIEVTKAPVIASHSSARALTNLPEHDRRHATRSRKERRRGPGQLLQCLYRRGLPQGGGSTK